MRIHPSLPLLALAALIAQPALAAAPAKSDTKAEKSDKKSDLARAHQQDKEDEAEAGWVKAPIDEQASVTHHVATTQAGPMKYTATAGTLTIRDDNATQ